jgi:hypothetical protein
LTLHRWMLKNSKNHNRTERFKDAGNQYPLWLKCEEEKDGGLLKAMMMASNLCEKTFSHRSRQGCRNLRDHQISLPQGTPSLQREDRALALLPLPQVRQSPQSPHPKRRPPLLRCRRSHCSSMLCLWLTLRAFVSRFIPRSIADTVLEGVGIRAVWKRYNHARNAYPQSWLA